jgi:hypothetical protein
MLRKAVFCAAVLLIASALSCSRAEPEIVFWSMKLVYYAADAVQEGGAAGGGPVARMTFFVLPNDPDGPNDIEEIRLYHDGEGLLWQAKSLDWIKVENGGLTWFGTYSFAPPEGEGFPTGQYRAELIDKGGETSSKVIGFNAPKEPPHKFPTLTIADGNWTIECEYPVKSFLCYNADGRWIATVPVTADSGRLSEENYNRNTRFIALWAEDPDRAIAALTTRLPTR